VSQHPLAEGLYARLMLALHHTGRRGRGAQRLTARRTPRCRRNSDWNLPPPPAAPPVDAGALVHTRLHARHGPARGPRRGALAVSQLAPDITDFVGRKRAINAIGKQLLRDDSEQGIPVVTITGLPGVGKTTLATRMGHGCAAASRRASST